MVDYQEITFDSTTYWESVALRRLVLRTPLGLDFSKDELANEDSQVHLGQFRNQELIGCLVFLPLGGKHVKMRQVAIHPSFQRRGFGQQLVHFAEAFARERNWLEIQLHARAHMSSFYSNLGYEVQGSNFLEIGMPHIKMIKLLGYPSSC